MRNVPDLIEGMVDAALNAGALILEIYETDFNVEIKDDASPVTKADQAAEAVILEALRSVAPDIPIIAEESVAAGIIPEIDSDFFLVDPLDGTKEFIQRNGEFTVNIALIRDHLPAIGVIYTPVKGWLFVGEVGKGAWRADIPTSRKDHGSFERRAIQTRKAGACVDVVGSRSHHTPEAEDYLKSYEIGEKRCIGSSLKFCLLAAGEADLYPRYSCTMEWDTAAGDAILTAAGGTVETTDGKRLRYGKRTGAERAFENPHFIAKTWQG